MSFNIDDIRKQFPILKEKVNGKSLVYLDNGASSQKPQKVLDAIVTYYSTVNSNVHRGIHTLSQLATDQMEQARAKVQHFINAEKSNEVIFTKGTTESINIVANGISHLVSEGDEILISGLEHHANIVPWQMLCQKTGAILKTIPIDENGGLDVSKIDEVLSSKTKWVAFNQVSNAFGVINPIKEIIAKAKKVGAYVLVDGAQAVPHSKVDVQDLGCDFYTFSGHKMYAPTGIGILYGREEILDQLAPWQGGGEMIKEVTFEKTTYAELPFRLEAGTPHIEGAIVLGTAIDWMQEVGIENIQKHEDELLIYASEELSKIETVEVYAKNVKRAGAVSFNLKIEGVHPSDVGSILDKFGIAVRTGHHCAQPIMQHYGITGTVRASFAVYNTKEEVDELIKAVKFAQNMLM
ncbi:cysteine desulfurase [Flavobacteriaceae bacterium UJ101]|nr:cysteine desulfurase [Flavobacteriaceae bacterium UJ101]